MTYILSDVHGEYELLLRLLEKIGFSDGDTLISCGDMIEKGKDSVRTARLFFSLKHSVLLAGNHEYAFLKYYWALMRQTDDYDGVLQKLQAYFPHDGDLLDWDTVDSFEALPYFFEAEEYICVHAGVPFDGAGRILPLDKASPEQLVYDRVFKDPNVLPVGGKCVFFGHTPTENLGLPPRITPYLRAGTRGERVSEYIKVHLDTGTYFSGVLGCFRTDDCRIFHVSDRA